MDNITDIVNDYLEAAIKYGIETKRNNSNEANKQYKIMKKKYNLLKNGNALTELVKYINHDEDYVKLWISAHVLEVEEEKAKEVLKELSKKSDMIGFEAKMTLEQWEKGEMKL